jgi:uncharacterized surface protein with fasciclin (FAS1) repeats
MFMKQHFVKFACFALLFLSVTACKKDSLTLDQFVTKSIELNAGAVERSNTAPTIAAIAISSPGTFSALVAAVVKTGLAGILDAPQSNFTVFAPTDAAFAKLPAPLNNAANITAITDAATINTLRNVLLYHIIRGQITAQSIRTGMVLTTAMVPTTPVQNNQIRFNLTPGATPIVANNSRANVVAVNVQAFNGIIHVIDTVLLP